MSSQESLRAGFCSLGSGKPTSAPELARVAPHLFLTPSTRGYWTPAITTTQNYSGKGYYDPTVRRSMEPFLLLTHSMALR